MLGVLAALGYAVSCAERGSAARGSPPDSVPAPTVPPAAPPQASAQPRASVARPQRVATPTAAEVWTSSAACMAAVRRGERLARDDDRVRVGTWNLRWFPDGRPGKRPTEDGTDVAWLACVLAWMDVDALAVQEVKRTASARSQTERLLSELKRLTGARYELALDDCDNDPGQHVGVLWRTDRLQAGRPRVVAELNAHGEACKDQLRPGLALPLSRAGGIDFTIVSVHAKSGTKPRDYGLRSQVVARLAATLAAVAKESADADVIFAGDFNTMGCERCSPAVDAASEIDALQRAVAPRARRVAVTPDCSLEHSGRSSSLDHLLVRLDPGELPEDRGAMATGFCGVMQCRFSGPPAPAQRALSDHCPVLLDLTNADAD